MDSIVLHIAIACVGFFIFNTWIYKSSVSFRGKDVMFILKTFTLFSLSAPIMEESFFRYNLVKFCEYMKLSYINHITSIIFGLFHIFNYNDNPQSKRVMITHVILATYIGYILYELNDMRYRILVHSLINTITVCTGFIRDFYIRDEEDTEIDEKITFRCIIYDKHVDDDHLILQHRVFNRRVKYNVTNLHRSHMVSTETILRAQKLQEIYKKRPIIKMISL